MKAAQGINMPHDPKTAANWFIERGIKEERPLIHVEAQNLLYFAHGWMPSIHKQPLHYGVWEAWRYGPVLPEVYFNLNHYQGKPITDPVRPAPGEPFTDEETNILIDVYDYRQLGPATLAGISQARGGPWDRV